MTNSPRDFFIHKLRQEAEKYGAYLIEEYNVIDMYSRITISPGDIGKTADLINGHLLIYWNQINSSSLDGALQYINDWASGKFGYKKEERITKEMPVKTNWIDPTSGKKYSYGWGYDVDSEMPTQHKRPLIDKNAIEKTLDGDRWGVKVDSECFDRMLQKTVNNITKELSEMNYAEISHAIHILNRHNIIPSSLTSLAIKDVKFNDPATIVFWGDGTKTVVKCQKGDTYDPEKGLTMAIVKKLYGNKSNFNNKLKKWLPDGN